MADVSEVTHALAVLCNAFIYPTGSDLTLPSPTAATKVKTIKGWPDKSKLDEAIKLGLTTVSVRHNSTAQVTTRGIGSGNPEIRSIHQPSYTLARAGQNITVGGAAPATFHPQNVVAFVDGMAFVYQPAAGETTAQVAAGLAALIAGASATLNVVTIPNTSIIGALRVGVTGVSIVEVAQQRENFMISVWSPTPETRDAVGAVLDLSLKRLINDGLDGFLDLPDGMGGHLQFLSTQVIDTDMLQGIFRRDLNYSVEYATTDVETLTQITTITQTLEDPQDVEIARNEY